MGKTHRRTWQKAEQRVAEVFGAKRRPYSGAAEGKDGDDIIHPVLFVEVKYAKKHAAVTCFEEQVNKPATRCGKLPVLVLVQKGSAMAYIVAPLNASLLQQIIDEMKTVGTLPSATELNRLPERDPNAE